MDAVVSLCRYKVNVAFRSNCVTSVLTGGRLRLRSGQRGFKQPVSRDCLFAAGHAKPRLQGSLWKRSASAPGEPEAKWTIRKWTECWSFFVHLFFPN